MLKLKWSKIKRSLAVYAAGKANMPIVTNLNVNQGMVNVPISEVSVNALSFDSGRIPFQKSELNIILPKNWKFFNLKVVM